MDNLTQDELIRLKKIASLLGQPVGKKVLSAEEKVTQRVQANQRYLSLLKSGPMGVRRAGADFSPALKMKIAYSGILPNIFEEEIINNGILYADVEFPEVGASRVPFRGAPATIERGARRIFYNTFTIAINWTVFYKDMFAAAYDRLAQAKDKVGTGIAIALDKMLFAVLEASATTNLYPALTVSAFSKDIINYVRGEFADYDLVAKSAIVNPQRFFEFINVDATEVDQVTLNTIIETGYISGLYGIKFYMSRLCPKAAVYIITDPGMLGKYVVRAEQDMKISDLPYKMKYIVTGYVDSGLTLHNAQGVRKITIAD